MQTSKLSSPRRVASPVFVAVLSIVGLSVGACPSTPNTVANGAPPSASGPAPTTASRAKGRLVILGFDGADPDDLERLIGQGKLPHVKALGEAGQRGPLGTTNPPQSPVAWSAFATGMSAGQHGIFDFVGRDRQSYFPKVATNRYTQGSIEGGVFTPPSAENLRRGDSFWDVVARAGVAATTLTVPYAYPPPKGGARSVGGLGTPDLRGINSSYTLLSTDAAKAKGPSPAGGQIAFLEKAGKDAFQTSLEGPRLTVEGARQVTSLVVLVWQKGDSVDVEIGGKKQTLALGATGDYLDLSFQVTPTLSLRTSTRLTYRQKTPLEIYVEPLSNHPVQPYFAVSEPPALGAELWDHHGPVKTVGWVHDTSGLGADALSEAQFLKEAARISTWRKAALLEALAKQADGLVITVFTDIDRIAHMFWRHFEKDHPARDKKPSGEFAQALDDAYASMDEIIGTVRAVLGPDDLLLVVSDHGLGSFRRGFHMNRWLVDAGYLVVKAGVKEPRDFFQDVDWSKSRAYAMGTGGIYLNLRGRESQGIVAPEEASALAKEIAAKIVSARDGKESPVKRAYLGDEIYAGPERNEAPDVRVALAPGYRASWETSLGGIPKTLFSDNEKRWSGDHASAVPEEIPGILLSSRRLADRPPRIEDIAATAYAFFGVQGPAGLVGKNLLAN